MASGVAAAFGFQFFDGGNEYEFDLLRAFERDYSAGVFDFDLRFRRERTGGRGLPACGRFRDNTGGTRTPKSGNSRAANQYARTDCGCNFQYFRYLRNPPEFRRQSITVKSRAQHETLF